MTNTDGDKNEPNQVSARGSRLGPEIVFIFGGANKLGKPMDPTPRDGLARLKEQQG